MLGWSIQPLMIVLIYSTMLNASAFPIIKDLTKSRVPRQAGYFYEKPSVSFDLPARPQVTNGIASTVTSVAPPVKMLSQMMYYAYPAPGRSDGEPVNIGYSSPSTSLGIGSSTTPGPSGYNYPSQTGIAAGVTQISTATASYQTSGGVQVSTNAAGYNYNAPQSPSTEGTVSTNAPKYLPPTQGLNLGTQISANIPSSTPRPYSPLPTITQTATSALPKTLNTSYLPPNPVPTIAITSSPSPNVSPAVTINATPSPSYLPPSAPTQGPTPGTQISISTPAPTYLPPFF